MRGMILAAGLGTRLRPLTQHTPKPLIMVNGRPLIEHHILALHQAGIREIVINIFWLADKIKSFLGNGDRYGVSITYSHEPEPLETAGGIQAALPLLCSEKEPYFVVINGDIRTNFSLRHWLEKLPESLPTGSLAHLVLVDNPAHHPDGDFLLNTGKPLRKDTLYPLKNPLTHNNIPSRCLTFSGISVLHRNLFPSLPEHSALTPAPLAPLLRKAIECERASGEWTSAKWVDIGTKERLHQAERIF